MSLLRYYVSNPDLDHENRRLKAAQESLARARVRADAYLKQMERSQITEENALEMQTEQEYKAFLAGIENSESPAGSPPLATKEVLSQSNQSTSKMKTTDKSR